MKLEAMAYKLTLFLLFASIFTCEAAIHPSDTVHLWANHDVRKGEDVVLYTFKPEHPNGIGVIVCPGGSYYWLDVKGEGLEVADWLTAHGFTAYVLLYRTAGFGAYFWHYRLVTRGNRHPDMITDAQRALQWVYDNAYDYRVDRDKIGMIGFSAGGHLVLSAACFHDTNFLKDVGIVSDANLRPSFVASIYPVVTMTGEYVHKRSRRALLGDNRQYSKVMIDSLSLEKHIPSDCPPVFIVNCADDPVVDYKNSEILDCALSAKGIPHKYIQYRYGKHGFGVSEIFGTPESRQWKNEFLNWISRYFDIH